jgi:hypothetical protein
VIAFVQKMNRCDFLTAMDFLAKRSRNPPLGPRISQTQGVVEERTVDAPPKGWREEFQKGCRRLGQSEEHGRWIDDWRGWPGGTTRHLAAEEQLGLWKDGDSLAFPVVRPESAGEKLSFPLVGLHIRHGCFRHGRWESFGKLPWEYLPTSRQSSSMGAWPYILGTAQLPSAPLVVLLEGAWDAIAFAAHLGLWRSDKPGAEPLVVLGLRGKNGLAPFLHHYPNLCAPDSRFLIIPDTDAYDLWKEFLGKPLTLMKHKVIFQSLDPCYGKDLSDFLRWAREKRIPPEPCLRELLKKGISA